jgi:hypothetical protein
MPKKFRGYDPLRRDLPIGHQTQLLGSLSALRTPGQIVTRLSHTRWFRLRNALVEDDQGISRVREDESAGGQMIRKMGRQSGAG